MPQTKNHAAARIIASAFVHYPFMQYAFQGYSLQQREILLGKLYNKCVAAAAGHGAVLTTPDDQGALIWLPGKNFPLNLWQEIVSGMALIPLQIGIKPTLRLMNHDKESEGWI